MKVDLPLKRLPLCIYYAHKEAPDHHSCSCIPLDSLCHDISLLRYLFCLQLATSGKKKPWPQWPVLQYLICIWQR